MRPTPQELRDYQTDCLRANTRAWERRNDAGRKIRALNSLATGGGKTTIFAQMIRENIDPHKQRALAFVHRREIVDQMVNRISNQFAELETVYRVGNTLVPGIGVVMADQNEADARIVVSTVQSLHPTRLEAVLQTAPFDLVIIDECHHLSADNTYWQTMERLFKANPDLRVAGFTATPKRSDKLALAAGFDEIVFEWSILDGILGGYLVPGTRLQITSGIDLSDVPNVSGDYNQRKMLSVLDASNWLDLTYEAYETYLKDKRGHILAFMPNVDMSKKLVERMITEGRSAAHIDATTDKTTRADILRRYRAGEIELVSNYNVLTEGFDAPLTDAIIDGRPSRSATVKTQMWGRGLRPSFGKTDCLIIDLAVKDVRALESGTLLGKLRACHACNAQFYVGFQTCPHCGVPVPQLGKPEKTENEEGQIVVSSKYGILKGLEAQVIPLLDRMAGAWFRGSDEYLSVATGAGALVIAPPSWADVSIQRERLHKGDYLLSRVDEETRVELREQMDVLQREVDRAEAYTLYYAERRDVEYLRSNSDLASLIAEADREAMRRTSNDLSTLVKRDASWRSDAYMASDKQQNFIRQLAHDRIDDLELATMTKSRAAQLITHLLNVPTVKRFIESDYLP